MDSHLGIETLNRTNRKQLILLSDPSQRLQTHRKHKLMIG